MKFNGKNIITDKDITVTGAKNLGDNLSDILQEQQESIDTLKSNVKWLYKYGGTGSGGGGGSGSGGSGSWGIFATLGGRTLLDQGTITLGQSDSTNYTLNISIKNGNGNYSVEYTFDSGKTGKAVLTPENMWKTTATLNLPKNDTINIVVTDGTDFRNIETAYITKPYNFSDITFIDNSGKTYTSLSNDIFISDASERGLIASIDYNISIDAQTCKYYWEFLGQKTEAVDIIEKSGKLQLPIPQNLLTNDNAGLYNLKFNLEIQPKNQEPEIIAKEKIFNLIPSTLYLKVSPEIGNIYGNIVEDLDSVYKYKTSSIISLIVKPYFGINQNRSGEVVARLYDIQESGESLFDTVEIPVTENINSSIQIFFTSIGWKRIELECALGGESYKVSYYIYLEESTTAYSWYKKSAEPTVSSYFRMGNFSEKNKNLGNIFKGLYKQVFSADQTIKISGEDKISTVTNGGDILISLGIQYNEINNTNNPIASFEYVSEGATIPFCTIYQNKVVIENNTVQIFLDKTNITDFDVNKPENYHLIQILFRQTHREGDMVDYKQALVYIDGVLEGSVSSWFTYTSIISSATLYPGNYSINLFEIANFSDYLNRYISDIDINYYYNTYLVKSTNDNDTVTEEETSILDSLYSYDSCGNASIAYSIDNQMIKLQGSGAITEISRNVQIPTIVCKAERILRNYDSTGNTDIWDWMNYTGYGEQDSQSSSVGLQNYRCPVDIRWYNNPEGGGSGIDFSSSRIISGTTLYKDPNIEFYLRLQGSSTMRYKSKNFTLGVRRTSTEENTTVPVFSPNFSKDDTSTFLPDTAFTLKADVVDSSHSNNTSLGKFINNVYKGKITGGSQSGKLKDHVKICLEGFPVLMFLEITDTSSGTAAKETEYYYLGVYNFNLGRENQLNLGYVDLEVISSIANNPKMDEYSFTGITIPESLFQPKEDLIVAEVQGNSPMFDFSQYHNSILFKVDSIDGDNNFMFGDIVYGPGQIDKYKVGISDFVKKISAAGNYIFTKIGKEFKEVVDPITGATISHVAYRTPNIVPDCDYQYTKRSDGKLFDLIDRTTNSESLNPTREDKDKFNSSLLSSCIIETEQGETIIKPALDYLSSVYYYTICMAFGLVDSVQKNLNIKTWDGKTFGLYFYDMDTALGTSNSGGDTSYFCFTDYWKTAITKLLEDGEEVLDEYGNPIYINSGAEIFRDHYPEDSSLPSGYDIPSTYLFSISKYASCFKNEINTADLESPQNLWGTWRQKGGILESADKFIDNYFEGHLKKVPKVLLNLNYRNKYLYATTGYEFNATDLGNLKGRQIGKVRDWLNSRFHILDAYFNLNKDTVLIHEDKTLNTRYYEPVCSLDNLATNTDIFVLHDIFSPTNEEGNTTTLNREGTLNFNVRARNYTPLIHNHAGILERYLIEDENTTYNLSVVYNGNQTSKFGGSEGWTYLNSLNSFIQTLKNTGGFSLSTKRLEYVEGTAGTLTGVANFDIPAAHTLKLTSPEYSCKLNIDNSFYNLKTIDISNSKIQLYITGSKVSEINLENVNSDEISLNSCSNLNKVSITGLKAKKFTAMPVWKEAEKYLDLSSIQISNLSLSGSSDNPGELIIKNSDKLESLTFSNFSKVTVTGCPNLKEITCNDTNPVLKEITINSLSIGKISLIANNIESLVLNGCLKLNDLTLRKRDASESDIKLEKLKVLKLNNTSVSKIKRPIQRGDTWIELDSRNDNILYLTDYPNLETFNIAENKSVEYIKVDNIKNKPFQIKSPLTNCTGLKRFFGNLNITTSQAFNGCSNFSIHGFKTSDTGQVLIDYIYQTEDGSYSVVNNNRVCHPLEITGIIENDSSTGKRRMKWQPGDDKTNIGFNTENTNVLNSAFFGTMCTLFDIYYVFQNIPELYNVSKNLGFNRDKLISCNSCFRGITSSQSEPVNHYRFNWSSSCDNSPNSLLFKEYGECLGDLSSMFYGRVGRVRIFPTTYSENGDVIKEGLFYNIPRVTSLTTILYGGTCFTDRNVFKCSTGEYYNLADIAYFNVRDFIDGISDLNYTNIFQDDTSSTYNTNFLINNFKDGGDCILGNAGNLFRQCKHLVRLYNTLNSIVYLDYNKSNLDIPNSVVKIVNSINSSYAFGEMILDNLFWDNHYDIENDNYDSNYVNNTLEAINQSFRVSNSIESWFSNNIPSSMSSMIGDEFKDAKLIINNSVFKKFNNLTSIGYQSSDLDASAEVRTSNYSSFGGKLIKELEGGGIPEDLISHLKELKVFTGFFRNCTSKVGQDYVEVNLPGDLFINNTKLEDISRCFQDFKGPIRLTSEGFSNCTALKNVSYLFSITNPYTAGNLYDGEELGIISQIPYKFFYHGIKNTKSVKTITGNNQVFEIPITSDWEVDEGNRLVKKIVESDAGITTYTYSNVQDFIKANNSVTGIIINPMSVEKITVHVGGDLVSNLTSQVGNLEHVAIDSTLIPTKETITVESDVLYTTITDMTSCFSGHGWMKYYTNEDPEVEVNPDYQPFDFLFNEKTKVWSSGTSTKCLGDQTYMWSFDGFNYKTDDKDHSETGTTIYYSLDDNIINTGGSIVAPNLREEPITSNFFCPPDLFRYCTESPSVDSIFENTGYSAHLYLHDNPSDNLNQYVKFGITGRICPYLLKPIYEIISLKNFLKNAKRLSWYKVQEDETVSYLVPKTFFNYTKKISDLSYSFQGLCWPGDCKLDVFENIGVPVKVDGTFQIPFFNSTSSNPINISNVFVGKTITSARGTFSLNGVIETLPINASYVEAQYILFGINFTKSKLPSEGNLDDLKVCNVYDGYYSEDYVTFSGYDKKTDTTTEFKIHNGKNVSPYNYRTRKDTIT